MFETTGISVLCGAGQNTIAICSSIRYVHSLCRLSVCRTEVCVETTSVVDTHELLMAGWRDDARGHAPLCQNLVWQLRNLMLLIQEYLLLNDDHKQRGALALLELVRSTAQLREDNRICIWLEDVWSER